MSTSIIGKVYSITALTVFHDRLYFGIYGWASSFADRYQFVSPPLDDMKQVAIANLKFPNAIQTIKGSKVQTAEHTRILIDSGGGDISSIDRSHKGGTAIKATLSQEHQALGWLLSMVEMLGDISFILGRRRGYDSHRPLFMLYGSRANKTNPLKDEDTAQINFFVDSPSDGSLELIRAFQDLIHELTPPPSSGDRLCF